jgi:hypothetical protein
VIDIKYLVIKLKNGTSIIRPSRLGLSFNQLCINLNRILAVSSYFTIDGKTVRREEFVNAFEVQDGDDND